jgi:hypothetical protein
MKKFFTQLSTLLAALLVTLNVSAQNLTKFDSKPGSKMKMDGTSSIHDWSAESLVIAGSLEVDSAFLADPMAAKPGKIPAKVNVTLPVRSLKSGTKALDDRMYEAMKMTRFPKIEYRLTELTLKEAPKAATGPFTFDSAGELAVSGVTNKVSFPVTITRGDDKGLKVHGAVPVKMTSFGIEPPGLILGIKTGDEVKLTFDWVTAPSEAK